MQGQYQPRAPGIAAGQSARTTTATYFDYQGIMRTALPGELRPNFVYQNGIWVQDGYLREGEATNTFSSFNLPNSDSLHINNETCTNYTDTAGRTGFTCTLKGKSEQNVPIQLAGSYKQFVNSIYVFCEDFSKINITANFIEIDPNNRRYYVNGYFQPFYYNLTEEPLLIRVCGPMAEMPSETGQPTSWIPYGQTRGAD